MSISHCYSLPSKGWETTQQDVGDDSSCPDVHLKAISAQTQRNVMIIKQPIYSFVPFINSKLQEEDQRFLFYNPQLNCITAWLTHGVLACVSFLSNLNSANDALTLFLQWFQVLHMSGSRRLCKGVRPPQSLNQSLPVSGFCCHLHAHTPKSKEQLLFKAVVS